MGWLSGWAYRREITITEQSGSTLTDYQVRIELNSSNFDFSKANSDGSDIRFTEDDGTTLLPYWIEKWDNTNEEAVIWVKVPSIPANGETTIYLYYGNSGAESESDGDAVFELFDDFEGTELDTSKWDYVGSVSVSNGELDLLGLTSVENTEVISKTTIDEPCIIEFKVRDGTQTSANYYVGLGFPQGPWDTSNWFVVMRARYATGDYPSVRFRGSSSGETEIVRKYWDNTKVRVIIKDNKADYWDSDGDSYSGRDFSADSITFPTTFALFNHHAGTQAHAYFDYIFVRKYAEQEPTASVGSEEVAIFTISGTVKLPDGTPVEGAKVISIREDTYEIVDTTTSESDGSYSVNGFLYSGNTVIVIPSSSDQNGDIKCHIQPA